ncbi:MAG: glutathione S-transferase N-terminal domain-containing protein [Actinomycetota bacterium]
MPVKLHRCSNMWVKVEGHPCWRVQKALDEAGVEYEVVKHSGLRRGKRTEYIELTGQKLLPAIELEDGTVIREESKDLAARIREGRLRQGSGPA